MLQKGLFYFLLFSCLILKAQNHTISGYIQDQKNGEKIIGATIIDSISGKGTTSNNFGSSAEVKISIDTLAYYFEADLSDS